MSDQVKTPRLSTLEKLVRDAKEKVRLNDELLSSTDFWSRTAEELARELQKAQAAIKYKNTLIKEHERTIRSIRREVTKQISDQIRSQLTQLIANLGKPNDRNKSI